MYIGQFLYQLPTIVKSLLVCHSKHQTLILTSWYFSSNLFAVLFTVFFFIQIFQRIFTPQKLNEQKFERLEKLYLILFSFQDITESSCINLFHSDTTNLYFSHFCRCYCLSFHHTTLFCLIFMRLLLFLSFPLLFVLVKDHQFCIASILFFVYFRMKKKMFTYHHFFFLYVIVVLLF